MFYFACTILYLILLELGALAPNNDLHSSFGCQYYKSSTTVLVVSSEQPGPCTNLQVWNCTLQVSNPLAEDNSTRMKGNTNNETKKRFSEQLRDEGQSFRAVFDKRKQRIGVFENGDDE